MIWNREAREKMALRVWRWLEQEIGAGCIPSWQKTVKGDKARTYTATAPVELAGETLELPLYCKSVEARIERALDCPDLTRVLDADPELSYRTWSLVAERLGTEGEMPCIEEVERRRAKYWKDTIDTFDARAAIERQRSSKEAK